MPAARSTKTEVLEQLTTLFRTRGFDATSLSDISEATGLGKSSLYHYFPDGKEQMAAEVLAHLDATLRDAVFTPLRAVTPAKKRLEQLLDAVDGLYAQGRDACLLERLCASSGHARLGRPLRETFHAMLAAFEETARDAGLSAAVARTRAEDAVVRIEGALIVSAGLGDTGPFERVMRSLRRDFLAASR